MASSFKFFRSRVAHRLMVLFFISALVPIILLAIPSFNYIAEQLYSQTQKQLEHQSKTIGESVDSRINMVARELVALTVLLEKNKHRPTAFIKAHLKKPYSEPPTEWFDSLSIIRPGKNITNLFGYPENIPSLSTTEIDWLRDGKPLIKISNTTATAKVYLYQFINPKNVKLGLLAGELNSLYLWDFDEIPTNTIACALDKQHYPLYCTKKLPAFTIQQIASRVQNIPFGNFKSELNDTTYLNSYWSNFSNKTVSPQWSILISTPLSQALAPIRNFSLLFPIILICATLAILIISLIQIRKLLTPLEKLREGTRNVANQNFHTQVAVKSGDEFEELAKSFNQMSSKLGKQFNALETMARIDRLILSTLNIDNIVETILIRMIHAIPCDSIALIISDNKVKNAGTLYCRNDQLSTEITSEEILFTREDTELLKKNNKYLVVEDKGIIPGYLRPIGHNLKHYLLLPIFLDKEVNAIIVICYKKFPSYSNDDLRQARDLADRVAVALSNAAWEDKLYTQAHYDSLTTLPNRLLFQDRIHHALKRADRENTFVALLFLDLDHFKTLNDSLGHAAGDEFLVETAKRLRSCVRSVDTVARLGGDEFTVVIPDLENNEEAISHISAISNKILRETSKSYIIEDQEIMISVSIGIAIYKNDADNVTDLLKAADAALYYAKNKGKSNYQFYSEKIDSEAKKALMLETKLKNAIKNDELKLFFQPKIDLNSNKVKGAEALLRWNKDGSEVIAPEEFIPIAEDTGLINSIGEWALRAACKECKNWHNLGFKSQTISVNLSPIQFNSEAISAVVESALEESGLEPKFLELELTESTIMTDIDKTIQILTAFNRMGVTLSIDDFGTGYSSLSYLKKLPIHALKIDQSFIRNLASDPDNVAIVSAIITLAEHLNVHVIAEGVENKEELKILQQNNCGEVQGYYFSEPVSGAEYINFLKKYLSNNHNIINFQDKK